MLIEIRTCHDTVDFDFAWVFSLLPVSKKYQTSIEFGWEKLMSFQSLSGPSIPLFVQLSKPVALPSTKSDFLPRVA